MSRGPTEPRRANAPLTLAAMTLASSMILVDQTAVPLATPEVIAGLGGAVSEGQWILTANILPLAALMVFGGRLGDLLVRPAADRDLRLRTAARALAALTNAGIGSLDRLRAPDGSGRIEPVIPLNRLRQKR